MRSSAHVWKIVTRKKQHLFPTVKHARGADTAKTVSAQSPSRSFLGTLSQTKGAQIRGKDKESVATISVTETNCKCEGSCETTYMSDRKCYFNEIASRLANQTRRGPRCFLTFWNPTGPLSGPWLPGDTATINALKNIGNGNYSTPAGC